MGCPHEASVPTGENALPAKTRGMWRIRTKKTVRAAVNNMCTSSQGRKAVAPQVRIRTAMAFHLARPPKRRPAARMPHECLARRDPMCSNGLRKASSQPRHDEGRHLALPRPNRRTRLLQGDPRAGPPGDRMPRRPPSRSCPSRSPQPEAGASAELRTGAQERQQERQLKRRAEGC